MLPIRDHNPSRRLPFVTWALIAVNVVIYLQSLQYEASPRALQAFYIDYALIPRLVTEGYGLSGFFTSMFLHGGLLHLAGNMLFLFIFGDNIEDQMGHLGYALFYVACGLAAGGAQYVAEPLSPVPMVGASGAIAGVMGAYLLMFPRARVDILIILIVLNRILPLPAWLMLALWFAMQLFGGLSTPADAGGVAYWAHAGGFAAGVAFCLPLWLKRGGPAFWMRHGGAPRHPETRYHHRLTQVPKVPRRRPGTRQSPWGDTRR